jgi:hypothetical protein
MRLAARARSAGAAFELLPPEAGLLPSRRPVLAVTATRTGCGKSQARARVRLRVHVGACVGEKSRRFQSGRSNSAACDGATPA